MLIEVLTAIASELLLLWAFATHPQRVNCGAIGWWMPQPGVCRPNAPLREGRSARGGYADLSQEPPGEIRIPIYCTNGLQLRQEGTSAWCER